jgi:hypothetical protein
MRWLQQSGAGKDIDCADRKGGEPERLPPRGQRAFSVPQADPGVSLYFFSFHRCERILSEPVLRPFGPHVWPDADYNRETNA